MRTFFVNLRQSHQISKLFLKPFATWIKFGIEFSLMKQILFIHLFAQEQTHTCLPLIFPNTLRFIFIFYDICYHSTIAIQWSTSRKYWPGLCNLIIINPSRATLQNAIFESSNFAQMLFITFLRTTTNYHCTAVTLSRKILQYTNKWFRLALPKSKECQNEIWSVSISFQFWDIQVLIRGKK